MHLGIICCQHDPNVGICAMHFMEDSFVNLGEYKAGCMKDISDNLVLMNPRLYVRFDISLSVCC